MVEAQTELVTQVPFFLPTSKGFLATLGEIPLGRLSEPAVLLIPAEAQFQTDASFTAVLARRLATEGRPVLRYDMPGTGRTSVPPVSSFEEHIELAVEAADWFLKQTGLRELAVAGTCLGARVSLGVPAHLHACRCVVGVSCPSVIGGSRTRKRLAIRSRLARVATSGGLGAKLTPVLSKLPHLRLRRASRYGPFLSTLASCAKNARVHLIYGENDYLYKDFQDTVGSASAWKVIDDIDVTILDGVRLHGQMDQSEQHFETVCESVARSLIDAVPQAIHA